MTKHKDTDLVTTGRPHYRPAHPVAEPLTRASTVLFPTYEDFTAKDRPFFYGRFGTPTHRALEETVAALEGAAAVALAPSGLAAVTFSMLAFIKDHSHILVTDSAYDPTRNFCEHYLKPRGIETTYYDPRIGGDIASLLRDDTALILAESPGSLTFEVQDIPAISKAAGDIPVIVDNTWGAGYYYKPLALGAAVSVQAATKYLGAHADCLLGTIATNDPKITAQISTALRLLGSNVSADDAWLTHRGMRTMAARLPRHQETGLAIANWLSHREEVAQVYHPAQPDHPDHALWQRDFTGATGLFAARLHTEDETKVAAFCGALRLHGMGYSWGGYESLCIPTWPHRYRTAVPWQAKGQMLRFHAGLEDANDLMADIDQAFAAMAQA